MADNKRRLEEMANGVYLIWDAEGVPDVGARRIVLWRSFGSGRDNEDGYISIPRLVEELADELRSQYLAWVYALGNAPVRGGTVVEHLLIRPQLSFWWLGSLAQKFSISATSLVPDAIKLLALERLISAHGASSISLVSNNSKLADCLGAYCTNKKLGFEWRPVGIPLDAQAPRKSVYQRFPPVLRAVISFGWFCFGRLSTAFRKSPREGMGGGEISFFDVLIHLDKRAFDSGRFFSNYWTQLVEKLDGSGVRTNWYHLFYPQPAIRTVADASRLVRRFNENAAGRQFHELIDIFPPIATLLRAFRDFVSLQLIARKLAGFQEGVRPENSAFDLWPLHAEDWIESVSGPNALMECLHLGLFEHLLSNIPHQKTGVYICENQPWEMALISAWRQGGHGELVGVPHTTIRYWDLRYFYDPRSYASRTKSRLPLPDYFAVNGPVAKATAMAGGYPSEKMVEVEALRFLHLAASVSAEKPSAIVLRVLVCGDFLSSTNDRIFNWIDVATETLPIGIVYVFKPHPAFPYEPDATLASRIGLAVDERPLPDLLSECDAVIASAVTSAAVDAYCTGKHVVQVLDGAGLNANALRGVPGVVQARTPDELAEALRGLQGDASDARLTYFLLDPALRRWQCIIGFDASPPDLPPPVRTLNC